MPFRPPRPCTVPGCPELVRGKRPRCERHRKEYERRRSRRRRQERKRGAPTYDSAAWRAFRKRILRERKWTCEDCGERPFDTSKLHVHHVHEVRDGGAMFDPQNVVVCCRPCHNKRHPERRPKPPPDSGASDGWVWA